ARGAAPSMVTITRAVNVRSLAMADLRRWQRASCRLDLSELRLRSTRGTLPGSPAPDTARRAGLHGAALVPEVSMSSRVLALALALALGGACTVGAPPGFSSGDHWAFPLVGPLEDGVLLVPVTINGKGPYLFLLDPDAPLTSIDEALAAGLDLYGGTGA